MLWEFAYDQVYSASALRTVGLGFGIPVCTLRLVVHRDGIRMTPSGPDSGGLLVDRDGYATFDWITAGDKAALVAMLQKTPLSPVLTKTVEVG